MIEDIVNEINILDETSNLLIDIGSVLEVGTEFITAQSSTKFGRYENVIVLGTYKPVENESGLLLFVGQYKYPCFLPIRNIVAQAGEIKQ